MLDGRFDPALCRLLTGQDAAPVTPAPKPYRLSLLRRLLARPAERSAE